VATVREIIGLETGYTPLFEHSLRVIPEKQLRDVQFNKPLGVGENGAVYGAKWRRPPGHLATTKGGEKEIDVVLKEVFPRAGTSEDPLKKLLKEVRNAKRSPLRSLMFKAGCNLRKLRGFCGWMCSISRSCRRSGLEITEANG
jgi:hypothetical protein